ncbi:MAG: hypothetical protein ACRDHO_09860, partial [Actinomycetota bacterium]
ADQPYYVEAPPDRQPPPSPPVQPEPDAKRSLRERIKRRRAEKGPGVPIEPAPAAVPPPSLPEAQVAAPTPAPVQLPPLQATPAPTPPSPQPSGQPPPPLTPDEVAASFAPTRAPAAAPAYSAGVPNAPLATEITCPRCGDPSPRGLCEGCEYALLELRELMIGISEDR